MDTVGGNVAINVHLGTIVDSKIDTNMDGEDNVRILKCEVSSADDVQNIEQICQNGEQTNPLDDATVIILEITKSWKIAVAVKDLVEPDATLARGEKIIYSLDSSNVIQASVRFKNDGTLVLNEGTDWAVQFTALKSAFDQLKSDLNSMISEWNTFATDYVPGSPSTTGLPETVSSVSSSAADMANAKIDSIQVP